MNFFMNTKGVITASLPSSINQGANDGYEINLYSTFGAGTTMSVAFRLPNGEIKSLYGLTYNGVVDDVEIDNAAVYWWSLTLPGDITRYYGTVTAQFFATTPQMTRPSTSTSFIVGRGVPQVVDDTSPLESILQAISSMQTDLDNGFFAARAVMPWIDIHTYGLNEFTWYPAGGEYGQFVQSLKDNNNDPVYDSNGVLNADSWKIIVNFDAILEEYHDTLTAATQAGLQQIQNAADSAEANLNNIVSDAKSDLNSIADSAEANLNNIADNAEANLNDIVGDAKNDLNNRINEAQADMDALVNAAQESAEQAADSAEFAAQKAEELGELANRILLIVPELPDLSAASEDYIYAVVTNSDSNIFQLWAKQNGKWVDLGGANFIAPGSVTRMISLPANGWTLTNGKYTQSAAFTEATSDSNVDSSPMQGYAEEWLRCNVLVTGVSEANVLYTADTQPTTTLYALVSVENDTEIPSTAGYYTKPETDALINNEAAARAAADNNINTQINNIIGGQTPVGLAQKATADAAGNNIEQTYAKQSGTYAQLNVGHSTNADNATKATQDASGNVITETYATKTELAGKANTSGTYPDLNVGHATNADNATKATQDGAGNVITDTYATKEENALKADSATVNAEIALKQNITDNTLATTDKTVVGAINENKQAIDGLREDMINADHFKGFAADAAAVQSTPGDANDYIYCIGTGTIWNYGSSGWTDSGKPYPSDATPLSTTVPLADGTGAAGTSPNAARADHVHPTDTSRASAADLTAEISARQTADTNLNSAITNEASTRAAADTALSNRITDIENGTTPIPLAQKATADGNGNNIEQTYAKKDELGNMFNSSGTYPELTAGKATADASGNVITDTYATKEENAGKANTSGTYADLNVGHATDADNATKAAQDDAGNVITDTYATKTELSTGLAGKANTSGTYADMTVGNANNAGTASKVANALTLTQNGAQTVYDGSAPKSLSVPQITEVAVSVTGWSGTTATVSVTGMTANSIAFFIVDDASAEDMLINNVAATTQGAGTVTFTCDTVPANAITGNIIIIN